mgnify:CR=1 FL=1
MNNIKLLEYCRKNPEKFLDSNYMFVKKDKNLKLYVKQTKIIKHKLIAIKETLNKKKSKEIINQLLEELRFELKKHANYSEFGAFINACDSKIDEVYNDKVLLREITLLYLKERDINDIVPSEWIQALIDKGSSRKKGHAGENKLINILQNSGFTKVKKFVDFKNNSKCVVKFSKSGDFSNRNIKKNFNIDIGKDTQNKTLDLIIKSNNHIYLLEAKHLNTGGGGQNKQVLELTKVIKNELNSKKYHFIAFLDGIYSNLLLNAGKNIDDTTEKNKIETQYFDIVKTLKENKNNYWINTAGFKKLFS